MLHQQLTLSLGVASSSSYENYFSGDANATACAALKALGTGDLDEKQLYLWGEPSAGKTHLLSAACQDFAARGYQAVYFPAELVGQDGALIGMEAADLLCIDDVHLLNHRAQEALFHCINRCRDTAIRLLFASEKAIDELDFSLADLVTRLSWGPVFHLQTLSDDELPGALALQLRLRGLAVNDDVLEYIVRRYPRDMRSLMPLVERLDHVSLSEQRRITIPLVRDLGETTE